MDTYTGRVAFRIFGVSAICISFVHYFVQKFLDNFDTKHGKTIDIPKAQTQNDAHNNDAFSLSDQNVNKTETFTPNADT